MKAVTGAFLALGLGLSLAGGLDLWIHTRRADLADVDRSRDNFDLHLAGRARMARRLAPVALASGIVLLVFGLALALL